MQITLPWPPSVNHYWGSRVVTPRSSKPFVSTYITQRGKEYQEEVGWLARARRVRPLEGRLAVTVKAHAPDRRVRDLDNLHKALLDAMTQAGFWDDDGQIDRLTIERGEVRPKAGCVIVTIEELEAQLSFPE
nr:crossover junction endodeoxyribonuclease rusA [bacterium]